MPLNNWYRDRGWPFDKQFDIRIKAIILMP